MAASNSAITSSYLRFTLLLSVALIAEAFETQEHEETDLKSRFPRMVDGDDAGDWASQHQCFLNWTSVLGSITHHEECAGILLQVGNRQILTTPSHCLLPTKESDAGAWLGQPQARPYLPYVVPAGSEASLEIRCGAKAAKRSPIVMDGAVLLRIVRIHKERANKLALALAMLKLEASHIREIIDNHEAIFWNDKSRFPNPYLPATGAECQFVSFGPNSAALVGAAAATNQARPIKAIKGEKKIVQPPTGLLWPPLFDQLIVLASIKPRDELSGAAMKFDCLPGDSGGALFCGGIYFKSIWSWSRPLVGILQQIPTSASRAHSGGLEVGSCLASLLHVKEVWDDFFVESLRF